MLINASTHINGGVMVPASERPTGPRLGVKVP
jgi:hypothetical protein